MLFNPIKATPKQISLHQRIVSDVIKGKETPIEIIDTFNKSAIDSFTKVNKMQIQELYDIIDKYQATIVVANGQLVLMTEPNKANSNKIDIISMIFTIATAILVGVSISFLIKILFLN